MFDALFHFLYVIFYRIDCFFCLILSYEYKMFEVFAGIKKVSYDGGTSYDSLINIFFGQSDINTIYWTMACVGIVMSMGFTIYAVIKKMFDIDDKVKEGYGGILGNFFKGTLIILLLNFIIMIVLNSSALLMNTIEYTFNNSSWDGTEIEFDDSDYATMARILNTIGNYSLNPSRDSTYNINSCYNEIQPDLKVLNKRGVFNFTYQDWEKTLNADKKTYTFTYKETTPNWQMVITKIGLAHDLKTAQPIDKYDEKIQTAIIDAMNVMNTTTNFYPLQRYESSAEEIASGATPIDAIIFLSGTMEAANNESYNTNASIFDGLRYDYIRQGGKSIYDLETVEKDFNISFDVFNHLMIIIVGYLVAKNLLTIVMNCVARIFNMLILYLIAPPFIGMMPMDGGEKTKQWTIAFVVQGFGVFGSVIGMRLLMLVVPIIFNTNLVLFDSAYMNYLGKIIMLVAIIFTVGEASKMVNGILANNASMQSLSAGQSGAAAAGAFTRGALGAGKMAMGAAKKVGSGVASVTGAKRLYNKGMSAVKNSSFGRAVANWTGNGDKSMKARDKKAADNREKKENKKALKADLAGGGQIEQEAKEKLGKMSATEARDRYGMNESELNDLKKQHGVGTSDSSGEGGSGESKNDMTPEGEAPVSAAPSKEQPKKPVPQSAKK